MAESKVLSNISYTIHNNSNYDIINEETRNIIDVPYFPAQNMVDVSKKLNPYAPVADIYIPFYDANNVHRLYALINRTDARFTFIEFADNARYIHYKFSGNTYPQSRMNYGYSYDGENLFILGGYANGRCLNDLWKYNINSNKWENLNLSFIELGSNQLPTRRRKSNVLVTPEEVMLFGGETDTLTINTADTTEFIVPLNDVWSYNLSTDTWTNYDINRILPHRQGHIIYNSNTTVKIYIIGGTNEIGVVEPNAIWTVNKQTHVVTSQSISAPFVPAANNCSLLINGDIHIFLNNGSLYKWDNTNTQFVLVRTSIASVNPTNSYYWTVVQTSINYGANVGMGAYTTSVATLYNTVAAQQSVKTIALPPKGSNIPSVNIDNVQTFFYGGIFNNAGTNTFNESTYLLNHTTLNVQKFDFNETLKPTERVFTSLAYDSYNGRVWLFGGFDGTKFYNDLWYFDLGLKTWTLVHAQVEDSDVVYPAPRQKAGMCIVDTHYIYILGGYSDSNSFNDFWKYNIQSNTWEKIYTTDNIPWGSQYAIFQWRDRLWLFNGQQLYRYFFDLKQFKAQPFLMDDSSSFDEGTNNISDDALFSIIREKKYMDAPVQVTCINDHMMVQNGKLLFDVDLETKEVLNITDQYNIIEQVYWIDRYMGIGISDMAAYYINVSPMYPLTRNQLPHSYYHKETSSPLHNVAIYKGNTGDGEKLIYQDKSGVFNIQGEVIGIDKAALLLDNNVSFAGLPSQVTGVNFNSASALWNKTIEVMGMPTTYPITPWFLYSKHKSPISVYEGSQAVLYNDNTDRVYVVYQNGNTLKLNSDDNTFFVYYTKLWEGASFGYHKLQNKIYAFGGIRNDRVVYAQNGMENKAIVIEQTAELSHNGLLQFDLNVNEMNLGSIASYQKEKNVGLVDYTETRDYLLSLISKYIEGYADNVIPDSIDEVKKQIYLATQPLVDDLSQFDYVFENGTRPCGRAFAAFTQINNKLYIFGGAESVSSDCTPEQRPSPWLVSRPGSMINSKRVLEGNDPVYNTQEEATRASYFDMDSRTWVNIAPLTEWRYMASAVPSTDNRYIYIVGGFTDVNCTVPTNKITVYDTQTDLYEDIKGTPANYTARANPVVKWIDDDRLLIMYGFYTYNRCVPCEPCTCCTYHHIPRNDAWIYDKRNNIMYKAFENIDVQAAITAKDSFYVGDKKENTAYSLAISPDIDNNGNLILKANSWDLVTGIVDSIKIKPTNEIINDYDAFETPTLESIINKIGYGTGHNGSITLNDIIRARFNSNFRFRYCWTEQYGELDHKYMFIIGERTDESGIAYIEDVARGYKECHLRFWYVDLEMPDDNRYLYNISYEYPLPLSPVVLAYDGSRYIYAIYNKYNIWRLDFKAVLKDASGSYWYQCPPCLDCNFLGESRTNKSDYEDPWNAFFTKPNYLTLVSSYGRIARMDTNTFVWYLDKELAPEPPTKGAKLVSGSEIENNEVYLYDIGGVSGKVLDIYEKQWDNFFLDMRQTSRLLTDYKAVIDSKAWPTFLRRKRLYTMNHLGHIFYTWLRIDGIYDVEFQLQDFYDGSEIRIYGDYTFLQNKDNLDVRVYGINSGWLTINPTYFITVNNEIGWDWEGDYTRRYVQQFVDQNGDTAYNYSELPPNYVSINLAAALAEVEPISKIHVQYKNVAHEYSYVSRINKVELASNQQLVNIYNTAVNPTPLSIVQIEPITVNDTFSNQFAVYIRNEGDTVATNVVVYAFDNDWIQFNSNPTLYPNAWTIRDQNNPFSVAASINPGENVIVYIRAVNIDSRPHTKDLVVKGIYAFEG